MQADFDRELQSYFTDVEHLREMFKQWLTAPTLPKQMLVIHGVGGVGKSSLLRMFRLHCKSIGVPVALASGDEQKSALDVLTRWADDLKADGVRLPEFSKTFQHYRAIQAKVENEAAKTAAKLAKGAATTVVEAAASTIPGIGPLLGKLGGMGAEALVDWLIGFLSRPDIDLLLDPAKKLTADFLADLQKAAGKRRIVLMLDTFEQMTALEDWTREVAQQLQPNVLLVIAGRILPDWDRTWPTWMANAQVEELRPMSEEIMRALVRRYYATLRGGEPDPKQVEAIIRFARGLPMVVTSAVRLWVKYGVEDFQAVRPEVVADLTDRLLEEVSDELRERLLAAATLRWFHQSLLSEVSGKPVSDEDYRELRLFPFARSRAEGLALHDAVREIIDDYLKTHAPDQHRALHERAAVYFENRLEKATGEEAERLGLERLYHRIRADEETGIQLFQEMAEELVRYRLVNRLRALLNDVNTYPLERENSRLWREYYNARLAHLLGHLTEAEIIYQRVAENDLVDPKLKAYALSDWGGILARWSRLGEPNGPDRAIKTFEAALSICPLDAKLVSTLWALRSVNAFLGKWDKTSQYLYQAQKFFEEHYDVHGVLQTWDRMKADYALQGRWREMLNIQRVALSRIPTSLQNSSLRARLLGSFAACWVLAGRCSEAEYNLRESLEISNKLGETDIGGLLRDLAYTLGIQGKYDIAEKYFAQSIEVAGRYKEELQRATALTFWSAVSISEGKIDQANRFLQEAIAIKTTAEPIGLIEIFCYSGKLHELTLQWNSSEKTYLEALTLSSFNRYYFECAALTGLIRVKHAQCDYAAIPPLLAEAEGLAQQYEYNDHLASLRLTQGHIAWEGRAPTWENGFDAALRYYQHALIYALRYNRFLLDEVLSGRPQGTPLRPIIPECLKRGEEGRRMLIALRDWWQTGLNDIGTPRPDTISPIPEGIPLLEAERIAREREPGDGSPQKSVVEQIESALAKRGDL